MAARGATAARRPHAGRDAIMIDDGVSADAVWNESSSSSPRARRYIAHDQDREAATAVPPARRQRVGQPHDVLGEHLARPELRDDDGLI